MSINDFVEITIFQVFPFMQKNNLSSKMAARNGEKMIFGKTCQLTLDILEVKISTETTLSHTVSKINVLLHFMQNFKMAAKTGGENNFWKEMSDDSVDNLGVKNFIEITLSFLHFLQNFKMAER